MSKVRDCRHCGQPFIGRRDAKTCSVRCRKGLQRSRASLLEQRELYSTPVIVQVEPKEILSAELSSDELTRHLRQQGATG